MSILSLRRERWAALAAPPWVLWMITRGYGLQFAVPPRFAGIIHSQAQGESARVLQEEILSLSNKQFVSYLPHSVRAGFTPAIFWSPDLLVCL